MNCRKFENLKQILKYFPSALQNALLLIERNRIDELFEIRLKSEQPVMLVFSDEKCFITDSGRITSFFGNNLMKTSQSELKQTFERMCNYSVYSFKQNIVDGFITLENGCRTGVYGTAVLENDKIISVRNIKGLNVRLSGEHSGIASDIADLYKSCSNNLLICGPPASGKTTMIKDLCRILSDDYNYKIAVIDERAEFENFNMGYCTDVLVGYPKAEGVMIALRTLSPEIIIFDELGTLEEAETVINGFNSGVNFIFTVHCSSVEELKRKKQVDIILKNNSVDYIVMIKNKSVISTILPLKESRYASDCALDNLNNMRNDWTIRSICSERKNNLA